MLTDATERIYDKIPIHEIKLSAYSGPDKSANIQSLLPGFN